ncbi:autophagy-related protein 11-domain-containing protein [Flammula alnicola]|nr:autophagy-related protein 11-domain-containing protein [Flammula alnicola]
MLYAYGATVIEIVRRKEFSSFFYQRAQSILEVMAKVSASERKRRHIYRGEVNGQLPFETKGMDDPVPTIDFSPVGGLNSAYSFERADVDHLMLILAELETSARSSNAPLALKAVQECRVALEKQISKMDSLELAFDKIAERSLLSQSRLSNSRRRSTEAEDKVIQELAEELRGAQEAKAQQERSFQEERSTLQVEIQRMKTASAELNSTLSGEQERSARLERELHQVRAQMESEGVARRILEERNAELSADISKQRNEIARALGDATEQTKEAERLRQKLSQVQVDLEEEQANTLRHLEEARARGEDLELQIQGARSESEEVVQALKEASQEKDRLLKAQASEHDRIIRDHIAEADGDRAVLDRQFSELQAILEHKERELKDLRGDLEVSNADAVGLREELQRVEHELREARHVERLLRDDLKAGRASQHDFEQRMENSNRLIAQILDVAISFRNSHVKALHAAQAMASHPNSARHASNNLAESTFSVNAFRHGIITQPDEPSPIDPSDPSSALEILREFDHDHFLEAVTKTGTTIRKWQKQCKEYRERAKGKISFRNFAKGDLALFLPTRNSVSKPWAAFNVSFPHYFLQATGHLAEQLKTREWIVARITSITERVVDHKDPSSNPYGLGDGVKYYMLEVEDWTQPSHNNKRRLSAKKVIGDNESKEGFETGPAKLSPSALPPGPPEAEVEDTFLVTHPPNSHLFPARARANSSPGARPSSSLSRLLAQASSAPENMNENLPEPTPEVRSPTPPISPPPPPSPTQHTALHHLFDRALGLHGCLPHPGSLSVEYPL